MAIEPRTHLERLREVALDQHGYVTTAQAADVDVPKSELSKLVARGRLERAARGVYLVPQAPVSRFSPYMLAVLWTGAPEACLSHETALDAWEISDVNPDRIHVAVAKHRRIARTGGEGYVIHHTNLERVEVTWWEHIRTVTAPMAVQQCIEWGTPTYLLRQALERGRARGLILAREHDALTRQLEERVNRGN